ncbi:hypothetical protein HAZT_HAZT001156 [Hyalella azteca]|uniref:Uncharacterized protein n=1 Tax=Hyalella azteca TaxID=294128 RepID=A0A6A0HAX7_HYAAZ|nr:hypothetical protein HAZT_HAZT001156 [Hyalella azteca]
MYGGLILGNKKVRKKSIFGSPNIWVENRADRRRSVLLSCIAALATAGDSKGSYPVGPQPHNFLGAGGYDPFGAQVAPLHAYHGPQFDQGPYQPIYGAGGYGGLGYGGGYAAGYGYGQQPQILYVKTVRGGGGGGKGKGGLGGGKGGLGGGKGGGGKGKGGDYYYDDYGLDYGGYDYGYDYDYGGKGKGGGKGGGGLFGRMEKGIKSVGQFCEYSYK